MFEAYLLLKCAVGDHIVKIWLTRQLTFVNIESLLKKFETRTPFDALKS